MSQLAFNILDVGEAFLADKTPKKIATQVSPKSWADWFTSGNIITIILAIVSGSFFLGSWYMKSGIMDDLTKKFSEEDTKNLKPMRDGISDLKTNTAVLKTSIENLNDRVRSLESQVHAPYIKRAIKVGIKAPQISTVSAKPNATFTVVHQSIEHPSLQMHTIFTIKEVTDQGVVIDLVGQLYADGTLHGTAVAQPNSVRLKFGDVGTFSLSYSIISPDKPKQTGDLPKIKVVVLEKNVSNDLVIATGQSDTPKA